MSIKATVSRMVAEANAAGDVSRTDARVITMLDVLQDGFPDISTGEMMLVMADTLGRLVRIGGGNRSQTAQGLCTIILLRATERG
jgi:hypothetical protein